MSIRKIIAIGDLNHVNWTGADVATEAVPAEAVPSQERVDTQNHGIVSKDLTTVTSSASSAVWTVSEADANQKVLRPTSVTSAVAASTAYSIKVPSDGMWFVDAGAGGTGQNAAVITDSSATGVTVATGQVAGVMTGGGTVRRLTGDTSAT